MLRVAKKCETSACPQANDESGKAAKELIREIAEYVFRLCFHKIGLWIILKLSIFPPECKTVDNKLV
jgi:hypothetical protein